MIDAHDKIGTEIESTDLGMLLYLVFAASMIFCLGLLFGAYVL